MYHALEVMWLQWGEDGGDIIMMSTYFGLVGWECLGVDVRKCPDSVDFAVEDCSCCTLARSRLCSLWADSCDQACQHHSHRRTCNTRITLKQGLLDSIFFPHSLLQTPLSLSPVSRLPLSYFNSFPPSLSSFPPMFPPDFSSHLHLPVFSITHLRDIGPKSDFTSMCGPMLWYRGKLLQ